MVSEKNKIKSKLGAKSKRAKKKNLTSLSSKNLSTSSTGQNNFEMTSFQFKKELRRKIYSGAIYVGDRMEKIGHQIQKNGYPMAGKVLAKIGHSANYLK